MNILNNLSLRLKISLVGGIPLVSMILSVLFAIVQVKQLGEELIAIAERDIPLGKHLNEISTHQLNQSIHFERILHYGAILESENSAQKKHREAEQNFKTLDALVKQELETATQLAKNNLDQSSIETEKNEMRLVIKHLNEIADQHKRYAQNANEVATLIHNRDKHEVEIKAESVIEEEDKLNQHISQLVEEIIKFTEKSALHAEHQEKALVRWQIILLIFAVGLASLSSWIFSASILKRTRQLSQSFSAIENFDLSTNIVVDGSDEIGELKLAAQNMRKRLQQVILNIGQQSDIVASSSTELSQTMLQSSSNIRSQQSEIGQLASAINQMSATTQEMACNINETADSANSAKKETTESRETMSTLVKAVQMLAEQTSNAEQTIGTVRKDSENINAILGVIQGVAEQTNLLALNAAIEAARAGEQGRGFAVVADEVRTLASRTQELTIEINSTVEKLQGGTVIAVDNMRKNNEQVTAMVAEASHVDDSLATVTDAVVGISDRSTQIATAIEEQSLVTEEINRNVVGISNMGDDLVDGSQQIVAASEKLNEVAHQLSDIAHQFKL